MRPHRKSSTPHRSRPIEINHSARNGKYGLRLAALLTAFHLAAFVLAAQPGPALAAEPLPLPTAKPDLEAADTAGAGSTPTPSSGQGYGLGQGWGLKRPAKRPEPPPTTQPSAAKPSTAKPSAVGSDAPASDLDPAPSLASERPRPKPEAPSRVAGSFGLSGQPGSSPDEVGCRRRLEDMGVDFTAIPAIDDGRGCGIAAPILVRTLAPGVALTPPATINCRLAERLARWLSEGVQPAARRLLGGAQVVAVRQVSSYSCRTRNSRRGARLSEHAKGNALDIDRLIFASGAIMEVSLAPGGRAATAFQSAIRAAACRFFMTVLGPGSDAAHATHFHFDLARRRSGRVYCR